MNDGRIAKAVDASLAGLKCKEDLIDRVVASGRRQGYGVFRRRIVIAAAAVLLLMSVTAIAGFRSRLLKSLFTDDIPQDAVDLLHDEAIVAENEDVRVSIDEWLFDGSSLIVETTVVNKSEHTLLCTLGNAKVGDTQLEAGYASPILSGRGTILAEIEPGAAVSGMAEYDASNMSQDDLPCSVTLDVLVLRPRESVEYRAYGGEQIAYEDYAETEKADTVLTAALSFILDCDALKAAETKINAAYECMKDSYRVIVDTASFRAASTEIVFRIVPDDLRDIEAYGDEGESGHGRLYRRYSVWIDEKELSYRTVDWGWNEEHTQLVYYVEGLPAAKKPHVVKLIPLADDETPIFSEAAVFALD